MELSESKMELREDEWEAEDSLKSAVKVKTVPAVFSEEESASAAQEDNAREGEVTHVEDEDIDNDKDVIQYFQEVFKLRESVEAE